MKTLAKLIALGRTDGLTPTAGHVWRTIGTCCAVRPSETFFFRRDAAPVPAEAGTPDLCEFVPVSDASALEDYPHPRLVYVPYRKWFSAGSVCFLGLAQGKVVSYCWVHRGSYSLGWAGRFRLGDDEWWIGPVFVDRRHRRQGINTAQVQHAVRELNDGGAKVFYTATNISNHASMKSFARCGFVVIGRCRLRMLWRWPVRRTICELNDQGLMAKSLQ